MASLKTLWIFASPNILINASQFAAGKGFKEVNFLKRQAAVCIRPSVTFLFLLWLCFFSRYSFIIYDVMSKLFFFLCLPIIGNAAERFAGWKLVPGQRWPIQHHRAGRRSPWRRPTKTGPRAQAQVFLRYSCPITWYILCINGSYKVSILWLI